MKRDRLIVAVLFSVIVMACGANNLTPREMCQKGFDAYDEKNYEEAFDWFLKSAEGGDTVAQYTGRQRCG